MNNIKAWNKFAGILFLLLCTCSLVSCNKSNVTNNNLRFSDQMPLPSSIDQKEVIASAKQYTGYWIDGRMQEAYNFFSSESWMSDKSYKHSCINFLLSQRSFHTKILRTDKATDFRCVQTNGITFEKLFLISLSEKQINKNGQAGSGYMSRLLIKNSAMVQFRLDDKTYYQVWIRDDKRRWGCIHSPLSFDEASLKLLAQR